MKKILLTIVFLFSLFTIKAQIKNNTVENQFEKKNDVKINVYFTALGLFEGTYGKKFK